MTPEEIQRTIEGMLAVQKGLQDSQLTFSSNLDTISQDIRELRQSISDFKEITQQHERRLAQLIGYSLTDESDRLDLRQRLTELERRLNKLEGN